MNPWSHTGDYSVDGLTVREHALCTLNACLAYGAGLAQHRCFQVAALCVVEVFGATAGLPRDDLAMVNECSNVVGVAARGFCQWITGFIGFDGPQVWILGPGHHTAPEAPEAATNRTARLGSSTNASWSTGVAGSAGCSNKMVSG